LQQQLCGGALLLLLLLGECAAAAVKCYTKVVWHMQPTSDFKTSTNSTDKHLSFPNRACSQRRHSVK
jgi:hypothetical protein